jgi:hypothetical protein
VAKKVLRTVTGAAAGFFTGGPMGAVGGATAGLLGGGGGKKKKAAPAPAAPTAAPVMPIADDEAVRRARKQSIARQMGRGGRTSTMLTSDSETLGGY